MHANVAVLVLGARLLSLKESPLSMSSVGQQAFSVFCDEKVRETVEENERLREQNASLEPVRSLLLSAKMYLNKVPLKEINLVNYEEEDDDYFSYSIGDVSEFPYAQVKSLSFSISGVDVQQSGLAGPASVALTILEDSNVPSVKLVAQFSSEVRITGILTNLCKIWWTLVVSCCFISF